MSTRPRMEHPLVRKLENFAPLAEEEKDAIRSAPGHMRELQAREDMIREDDPPGGVNLLLDGMAFRYKILPGGRRQILSWMTPGDLCDVRVFLLRRMDHAVGVFCPSRVFVFSRETVLDLAERFPKLGQAFWWNTLVEESIAREWLVNVGQRSAIERAAHLLCEVFHRLRAVGMAEDGNIPFPVTQQELGDTLGLSTVHVNRTMQELRRDGLIALKGRHLEILDLEGLERTGGFNPNYLHLDRAGVTAGGAPFAYWP